MTLYRDEDGNLESDDFIPKLATDEDLIQRWKEGHESNFGTDSAMMIVMCANQLGKRGYSLNANETDWIKAAPDSQS